MLTYNYGTCELCQNYKPLIRHHWYENTKPLHIPNKHQRADKTTATLIINDNTYHYHQRLICYNCNNILAQIKGDDDTHVMVSWDKQVEHYNSVHNLGIDTNNNNIEYLILSKQAFDLYNYGELQKKQVGELLCLPTRYISQLITDYGYRMINSLYLNTHWTITNISNKLAIPESYVKDILKVHRYIALKNYIEWYCQKHNSILLKKLASSIS